MSSLKYWHHPTAEVDRLAIIGDGTKIWQHATILCGAHIGSNCTIGHNCFITSGAIIGNGVKLESNIDVCDLVTLEDFVFVGPSAIFTNDKNPRARYPKKQFPQYGQWRSTRVREGASIGANATIICGITIGRYAFIGAGAVVVRNVPDYGLIVGVPGKLIGWICECGTKLLFEKSKACCTTCQRWYKKEGDIVCNS